MKRLFEYIEQIFRAYRLSDEDILIMAKKGYYFDLSIQKWAKGGEKCESKSNK